MNNFSYVKAGTPEEALQALRADNSRVLAGGTDLLPLIKEDIVAPAALVDISAWKNASQISSESGGLLIGALTTLSALEASEDVKRDYTALSDACRLAATQQLRNMGTIGGNLLQQTRCWYYRGPYNCWLKGGTTCYAREGENEYHSILHTDPRESVCVSAHPSDPAAALLALDARITVQSQSGEIEMAVADLYKLPTASSRQFTVLPEGALITGVLLPAPSGERRSIYMKAMARASWAFALAGVAIVLEMDGSTIKEARIALSGVAPIPVRVAGAEALLSGKKRHEVDKAGAVAALVSEAKPLSHNGYKTHLLQGVFEEAFDKLAAR